MRETLYHNNNINSILKQECLSCVPKASGYLIGSSECIGQEHLKILDQVATVLRDFLLQQIQQNSQGLLAKQGGATLCGEGERQGVNSYHRLNGELRALLKDVRLFCGRNGKGTGTTDYRVGRGQGRWQGTHYRAGWETCSSNHPKYLVQ